MANMRQPGTDMATKMSTGGRKSEEKKVGVPVADKDRGNKQGETGEREPKGATSRDMTGERHAKIVAGVAMGKADSLGARDGSHMGRHEGDVGEFNEGTKTGVCYDHVRSSHPQD